MCTIKIGHADDHDLFRDGLVALLEKNNPPFDFKITPSVSNGMQLLHELSAGNTPDILLLDIRMPLMNGFEVSKILRANYPSLKIIMFTMFGDIETIQHFERLGVHGYLLKSCIPKELISALESIYKGGYYFEILNRKNYLED